jgi:hypothetical protein
MKIERCYWYPAGKPKPIGWRWRWTRTGRWYYWLSNRLRK